MKFRPLIFAVWVNAFAAAAFGQIVPFAWSAKERPIGGGMAGKYCVIAARHSNSVGYGPGDGRRAGQTLARWFATRPAKVPAVLIVSDLDEAKSPDLLAEFDAFLAAVAGGKRPPVLVYLDFERGPVAVREALIGLVQQRLPDAAITNWLWTPTAAPAPAHWQINTVSYGDFPGFDQALPGFGRPGFDAQWERFKVQADAGWTATRAFPAVPTLPAIAGGKLAAGRITEPQRQALALHTLLYARPYVLLFDDGEPTLAAEVDARIDQLYAVTGGVAVKAVLARMSRDDYYATVAELTDGRLVCVCTWHIRPTAGIDVAVPGDRKVWVDVPPADELTSIAAK